MNEFLTVYKASAGSGKTFTLTKDYISLLLSLSASTYRQILAVTFTNKATGEMKARILGQLYGISRGLPASDNYFRLIRQACPGLNDAELRDRAGKVLQKIVHDYDHFRVTTIDSFFQSVMTHVAHELGLSANFHVDINDIDIINQAVDRLMADLASHASALQWVIDYVSERIDDNRSWNITREVKQLARNLLREQYLLNENRLKNVLNDDKMLRAFRQALRSEDTKAAQDIMRQTERLEEQIAAYGMDYTSFSRGQALSTYLTNIKSGKPEAPKETVKKYLDSGVNWLKSADRKKADRVEACDNLCALLHTIEEKRQHYATVHNNYRLTTAQLGPLRLLGEIARTMAQLNDEANRFMLAKVPILLKRLNGDEDASFIFEKAGTTYQHVMIDEFQDTSSLQWSNFKNLLVENMSSGNTCLLVGDVKQSIYRFRNGDWRILNGIREEFPHHPLRVCNLDTNYRSLRRIIDFNNRFFIRAAEHLDRLSGITGDDRIARLYADVAQKSPDDSIKGYVRVRLFSPQKEQDDEETADTQRMADFIARIRTLHEAGLPYPAMTILVRWNREAAALVEHFAAECPDIPVVSDEAFLLSSSEAVQLLIHAMRYLADEHDTIALAYVIRHHNAEPAEWSNCEEGHFASPILSALSGRRDELLRLPLYELQEELIRLFHLHERPGQSAYLLAYLDQVLAFLDENPSDVRLFLEYWNDSLSTRSIPSAKADGIRIQTIHKSKGLEAHTILLPFCDWFLERDRNNDLLWCEPSEEPYSQLPLVPIPSQSSAKESIYSQDYTDEHFQRRIENLNLLYVAFTRARKNLLMWAIGKKKLEGANTTVGDLIGTVLTDLSDGVYEEGDPVTTPDARPEKKEENRLEITPIPLALRFHSFPGRVHFRQSNQSQKFVAQADDPDSRQGEYIDQGILLHQIFSAIGTANDVDRVLNDFETQGIFDDHFTKAAVRKIVERGLASPIAAQWFDGSWKLFREASILPGSNRKERRTRRPDRVMFRRNETVVVDFKFGKPSPQHVEQVRDYLDLLTEMGRPSPQGFLWYVFTNKVVKI